MSEITIRQLDQGYLVQKGSNPVAALTTGRDLCDWIAVWSKAKVDIFEVYEAHEQPKPPVYDSDVIVPATEAMSVELDYATAPQEPQESDPEPEPVEVPDEPERASREGPVLTAIQLAVLKHIEKCAKPGERFQIGVKSLASRAGVSKGGVPFYLSKLKEAGLIDHEPPYGGDVFITRLKAAEVAA